MVRCTVLTLILGVVLILSGHIVDGKRRRHTSKALECPQTQDLLTPDICGASQLDGTPYEPGSGRGVVQPCWAPPQYTDLQRTELCDNATAITALTPNGAVIIKRCTHVYNLWRMHMTPNPYHQRIPLSSACLVLNAQGEVIKNDTSTCQTLSTTCTWGPFAVAAGDTSEVAENETEYQPMTGYMCCGADGPRGRSRTRDRGDKRNSRKKNKRGKGRKTRRRNGERRNGRKRGDKKKNRVAKKGNSGRVSRRKGKNKKEGDDEKHGNSVSTTGEEEGDSQDTGTASSKKVEGRRSRNRNGKNGRGGKARKSNQGGRKSRGKSNRGKDRKQHRNSRKRNRKGSRGGRGQRNKEAPEEEEATDEEAVDDEYIYQEDNDGTDMGA